MRTVFSSIYLIFSTFFISNGQQIKGTYAIKNVKTGMLLRIKDAISKNGTPLVAYPPQEWKCMTWEFLPTTENTYQLKNLFTKKTFQPVAEPKEMVSMEEQPLDTNSQNQQYDFIKIKKDTYLIRLKSTELYLCPADPEGSTNSAIVLSTKKDTPLLYWSIYLQNPTM